MVEGDCESSPKLKSTQTLNIPSSVILELLEVYIAGITDNEVRLAPKDVTVNKSTDDGKTFGGIRSVTVRWEQEYSTRPVMKIKGGGMG